MPVFVNFSSGLLETLSISPISLCTYTGYDVVVIVVYISFIEFCCLYEFYKIVLSRRSFRGYVTKKVFVFLTTLSLCMFVLLTIVLFCCHIEFFAIFIQYYVVPFSIRYF